MRCMFCLTQSRVTNWYYLDHKSYAIVVICQPCRFGPRFHGHGTNAFFLAETSERYRRVINLL